MTLTILSLEDLWRFLFVVVRLSAILLPLPFLGMRLIPAQLKVVLVLVMSVGVYPAVQTQPILIPLGPVHLVVLLLGELCIGLLIGLVAQVLFSGIQLGGELMNQQMGLSMASILDPENAQQSSVVTNFQYIVATLVFFSGSAHHWFIHAMAESLHMVPLLQVSVSQTMVSALVTLVGKAGVAAVQLAAPLVVTLVLTNIALGIVERLVPQMHMFLLGVPVSVGVGLLVLWCAQPYFLGTMQGLFTQLGRQLFTVMRLLGGA
jgi:flagellar biosynthetic protein FliR